MFHCGESVLTVLIWCISVQCVSVCLALSKLVLWYCLSVANFIVVCFCVGRLSIEHLCMMCGVSVWCGLFQYDVVCFSMVCFSIMWFVTASVVNTY